MATTEQLVCRKKGRKKILWTRHTKNKNLKGVNKMGLGIGFEDECDECGKEGMVFGIAEGEKLCEKCFWK